MDREQEFKQSQFYQEWEILYETVSGHEVLTGLETQSQQAYKRFIKVIYYIHSYIQLIDYDLLVLQEIQQLDKYNNCPSTGSNFSSFMESKNVNCINKANESLDDFLSCIKNILLKIGLPKKKIISNVFSEYNKILQSNLETIDFEEVKQNKEKIDDVFKRVVTEIGDNKSILNEVQAAQISINEKKDKINEYYNKLLNGTEENQGIKNQIEIEKERIINLINELDEKINESTNKQDKLNKFYIKIFGDLNQETGNREGGLEQQFKKDQKDFKDYEEGKKESIKLLKSQIKGLMPNATSVGLATSFSDEAEKMSKSTRNWTMIFIASLALLIISSITNLYFKDFKLSTETEILSFLLTSLPFSLPLIWMTLFCGKRRSEANRMYHEYKHKEAVANSFSSYKDQIKEIKQGEESARILQELLTQTIKIIGKNPSDTLSSGKHSSNSPVEEILKNSKTKF